LNLLAVSKDKMKLLGQIVVQAQKSFNYETLSFANCIDKQAQICLTIKRIKPNKPQVGVTKRKSNFNQSDRSNEDNQIFAGLTEVVANKAKEKEEISEENKSFSDDAIGDVHDTNEEVSRTSLSLVQYSFNVN
jgi:hypothetical protein|tara:strand:+ start:205 stop:603 length:399 start_codon:yes stop_codon:yes gene_type:complete